MILPSALTRNLPVVKGADELEPLVVVLDELELGALDLLVLTLELVLTLDEDDVVTEDDDAAQPFTTPKGAGCAAQVVVAIQLLPFS